MDNFKSMSVQELRALRGRLLVEAGRLESLPVLDRPQYKTCMNLAMQIYCELENRGVIR